MLRASVIFSLFALQILPLVAQEKIDSVCVFRFCLRRDMFFVPYKSNEPQLEYLLAFVGRHKEEILNQRMFLIVNGYCNSLPTHKANLATAKLRSNRVKSELIVRRGLKEDCFITRNHAECGEYVTVSVHVVVSLADTLSEVGGVASVAMKTAPVRLSDTLVHLSALTDPPFMPPTVYPLPACTLMQYLRPLCPLRLPCSSTPKPNYTLNAVCPLTLIGNTPGGATAASISITDLPPSVRNFVTGLPPKRISVVTSAVSMWAQDSMSSWHVPLTAFRANSS